MAREEPAPFPGHRQHPLARRDMRNDSIHEVRRTLRHPPPATGRAKSPSFARKKHEPVVITVTTFEPGEAGHDVAATQIGPELPLDVARQGALMLRELEKQLREALGDNRAKLLRPNAGASFRHPACCVSGRAMNMGSPERAPPNVCPSSTIHSYA